MRDLLQTKIIQRLQKISSTDLLVLFTIFFAAATVYFFFSRKTEYLDVTIKLFDHDSPEYSIDSNAPKSWYVEQIKTGKAQKTQLGETLVEISDVYSYPNAYVYNDVYVTLRVKAIQNKVTKQYIYEGSPLLIHDIRSFKIQDLLLNGEIIDISQNEREKKEFHVVVELKLKNKDFVNSSESIVKGIENYVANVIHERLKVKDSNGEDIAVVTKVTKKPGRRVISTNSGPVSYPDNDFTQVVLEVDVVAEKINNYYFYRKKESLLVGETIWFTFEPVSVVGTIISVEEK